MVNDAGGAACGAAGKSTVVLASASCATLVPGGAERGSEDVNVGSALSSRVGVGAMCEAGAIGSGRAGEVDEAAGCTFSCVPSEMKVGSGLLGAAGITGGGGSGGVNAAGAAGTAGGGTTAGGAGATNETGAAGGGITTTGGATGAETFCTGAAFSGASGITTGAAAEIIGVVSFVAAGAGPSDGK